jgi:hypothetical protein
LPKEGAPYNRKLFAEQLSKLDLLKNLEACGPSIQANIWLLTFDSAESKTKFIRGGEDFESNGIKISVALPRSMAPNRYYIKLHWVPYEIPTQVAYNELQKIPGIKILSAGYENAREEGFQTVRTGVRLLTIETKDPASIPYLSTWTFMGRNGRILISLKGRPQICLKCSGHFIKDCTAVKCNKCYELGHTADNCTTKRGFAAVLKGDSNKMETEENFYDCHIEEVDSNNAQESPAIANGTSASAPLATGEGAHSQQTAPASRAPVCL